MRRGSQEPSVTYRFVKKFYGASIGVYEERQKFLFLLQEENEQIASWETRVRNQGSQCEYLDFADKLIRDQFIAGLVVVVVVVVVVVSSSSKVVY